MDKRQSGLWAPPSNQRPSTFKKADPPVTGEIGKWQAEGLQFASLPGGGVLQFDLSRLTLNDYRQMRDHYQINANLSLLTFMIHQIDWKIKCADQNIADEIEEQLRPLWTQIVRGFSQAFWSGFSGMALQYKNDVANRSIVLDKVKDLQPETTRVNWKEVTGYTPSRGAPKTKYKVYDGIKQEGSSHPIPVENTLWYPLLAENGDYYGRKLLRPAFIPWFFSMLIHLYANRYFERFGEPLPIGRADYDAEFTIGDQQVSGREAMENILMALRSRSVVTLPSDRDENGNFDFDLEYLECVDSETEIFTERGWKRHDEVVVGDMVLTLNHDTGLSSWQPVQKMNVFEVEDRDVVAMEGSTHSSLTTENHRWPVLHSYRRKGERVIEREWRYTSTLDQRDRIPLCAEHDGFPTQAKYDDDFVELVAWYWTEGYIYVTGNYVSISQKRYPERIRGALTRLFGPASEKFPRAGGGKMDGVPRWRENGKTNDEESRQFFLNYEATQMLNEVAPGKMPSYEFMLSLTRAQLDLYIDSSLLADGNVTDRQTFLMQKSHEMAERFQFACTLAGHATSFYELKEKRYENYSMWVVSVRRKKYVNPVQSVSANGPFSIEHRKYTGVLWCPTTQNSTWLARRRGTVYFTGNSQMRGADFERYLTRLDEEMSLGLFTPILMLRTSDVGSYNLGIQHQQVWMWMLNAIAGDMKQYLDDFLIQKLKAFNFTPNAPRAEWVPRPLGKQDSETMRAVVSALMRDGMVKLSDLDELGQALGMSIEEIKGAVHPQQQDDPEPTGGDTRVGRPEREDGKPIQVEASHFPTDRIADRVRSQVSKAFREGTFGTSEFAPDLGYRRHAEHFLVDAGLTEKKASDVAGQFYSTLNNWLDDFIPLGTEGFSGPNEFMASFQKVLEMASKEARS